MGPLKFHFFFISIAKADGSSTTLDVSYTTNLFFSELKLYYAYIALC